MAVFEFCSSFLSASGIRQLFPPLPILPVEEPKDAQGELTSPSQHKAPVNSHRGFQPLPSSQAVFLENRSQSVYSSGSKHLKNGNPNRNLGFFSPSTCPFHHCVSKLALLKFSSRVPRRDGEAHRSANYWKCLGVLYLNLQRVKLLWQRNIIAHEISQLRVQGCGSGRLSALTRLWDEREG